MFSGRDFPGLQHARQPGFATTTACMCVCVYLSLDVGARAGLPGERASDRTARANQRRGRALSGRAICGSVYAAVRRSTAASLTAPGRGHFSKPLDPLPGSTSAPLPLPAIHDRA